MVRSRLLSLLCALLALTLVAPSARADDGAPAGDAAEKASEAEAPVMASDEEVAAALEAFKDAWKATGLRGTDKVMQRDYAMRLINELHHPEVVKALGKASRNSDDDVRLIALIYLGDQTLLPHQAAEYVLAAMKRNKRDVVTLMTGLQSLGSLKYLGASHQLRALLKHRDFVVRKSAIAAVGSIGDLRLLEDVLKVLGVKLETEAGKGGEAEQNSGGKETVEEGYSWEGAEAVVDRGEADNTQENADAKKQAEAKIAANKAAAMAGAGKGGGAGGGVSGMGGTGGRGGSARSTEELTPTILRTLKKLTGEEFRKPSAIRAWVRERGDWLKAEAKRLDELEKAQKRDG